MLPWLVSIFSAIAMFVKDALMQPPIPRVETPQMTRQMLNRPYPGMYVDTPLNTQYRDDRAGTPTSLPLRQTMLSVQSGLSNWHQAQMSMQPPAPR